MDHEVFRTRLWTWTKGERTSQLVLTADNGSLTVAIGPDGQEPHARHVLTLEELDRLIEALPALRAWVSSGRPAAPLDSAPTIRRNGCPA